MRIASACTRQITWKGYRQKRTMRRPQEISVKRWGDILNGLNGEINRGNKMASCLLAWFAFQRANSCNSAVGAG